jgi:L-fuconolactonase
MSRGIRIDAHQHFWSIARGDYGWLTPAMGVLYRDFGEQDLKPLLDRHGVAGTVLVQAAPTEAETHYLLDIAERSDLVLGVVGWSDLEAADAIERIERLAKRSKLKGLRPMLQDLPNDDWIVTTPIGAALDRMASLGLVFDALVKPRHLRPLLDRLHQHPKLQVVIDHAAKPSIGGDGFDTWRNDLAALAALPQVYCKLSGLFTEAPAGAVTKDLRPYADAVLECFGPERVIWGSDWPVLTLAATYDEWVSTTNQLLGSLSDVQWAGVLGDNAMRVYRLLL